MIGNLLGGAVSALGNLASATPYGQFAGLATNALGLGGSGVTNGQTVEDIFAEGEEAEKRNDATFQVAENAKIKDGARNYDSTLTSFSINGRQTILENSCNTSLGYLENMTA